MIALEKRVLRIGYTPLSDCLPLATAHELGYFAEHGLEVHLERQSSWATARDLLRIGALDGAHMLAPATVASWMHADDRSMIAPIALSLNGNTITLSLPLFAQLEAIDSAAAQSPLAAAKALGVLARRRAAGERPLRFAAVFTESNHHLDLLRWLKAGGVHVGVSALIAIVPPGEVEQCMAHGLIDGFCVGEPWGSLTVARGGGRIVANSYDLYPNRIEKVLALNTQFAAENPITCDALLQAVLRAAQWADAPENRSAAAALLVDGGYINAPIDVVRRGLMGPLPYAAHAPAHANGDFLVFHRHAANYPWRSQARWFARELIEAKLAPADGAPLSAFRPALYAKAAEALGLDPMPSEDAHRFTPADATAERPRFGEGAA